ncbi:MAG: hypothetical protein H0X29_02470, partial [Parachlamydiaceae bacterium]|nr:hypothetical protein [Parachlamydiaceae bacterium]
MDCINDNLSTIQDCATCFLPMEKRLIGHRQQPRAINPTTGKEIWHHIHR